MSAHRSIIKQDDWLPLSTLRFFERQSVPMARLHLPLSQTETIRILKSCLERLSRDSYYISVVAREVLTDNISDKVYHEDEVLHAEQEVFKALAGAHEAIDGVLRNASRRIAGTGFKEPTAPDSAPLFEVHVASNVVSEFLNLLAKADLYFLQLNFLWQIGELSDTPEGAIQAKVNGTRAVRQRVTNVLGVASKQFNRLRDICHRVREERRARSKTRKLEAQKAPKQKRQEQLPSDVIIVEPGSPRGRGPGGAQSRASTPKAVEPAIDLPSLPEPTADSSGHQTAAAEA